MQNTKITPKQAVFLVLSCTLSTIHVFIPNELVQFAGRDVWISALLAPIIGCLIFFIVVKLAMVFPNHSLAGVNKRLLGKYLGGLITIIYILSFLALCTKALIQFAVIMAVAFKPESVPYVWHLIILVPAMFVVAYGISVPARMNEIILPLGLGLIITLIILNIPNINLREYLPVFQYGYIPALMGGVFAGGNLAYAIVILALMPIINKKEKIIKSGISIFAVITAISLTVAALSVAISGLNYTEVLLLPTIKMIRTIDIGFFSRLDPVMMTIWQMGFFIVVATFIYSAAILTKDLFNFKGYRVTLLVYGVIVMVGANAYITNLAEIRYFFLYYGTGLLYTLGFVIPLMLYGIAKIKGYPKKG